MPAPDPGHLTRAEIFQQPDTWPETVRRVRDTGLGALPAPVLTGAGTSAYAALAVGAAWPASCAVPSTELFLDARRYVADRKLVVSFARSGDSPESTAVIEKIQRQLPEVRHLAVTCNAEGRLARHSGVQAIVLDPRTNDRSLVMTSSFSNLVLAGLALARAAEVEAALPTLCAGGEAILQRHETTSRTLAESRPSRVAVLASAPLFGAAREAWLKILEMTSGCVVPLAETYLGLRHGPMSFIGPDTLVLCFISSDPARRRYELDLVAELRAKKLGRRIALAPPEVAADLFEEVISTAAASLPDHLRTPADIVFAQLLAFHLSLRLGFDPDNPSPARVITRVVEGVHIYED